MKNLARFQVVHDVVSNGKSIHLPLFQNQGLIYPKQRLIHAIFLPLPMPIIFPIIQYCL